MVVLAGENDDDVDIFIHIPSGILGADVLIHADRGPDVLFELVPILVLLVPVVVAYPLSTALASTSLESLPLPPTPSVRLRDEMPFPSEPLLEADPVQSVRRGEAERGRREAEVKIDTDDRSASGKARERRSALEGAIANRQTTVCVTDRTRTVACMPLSSSYVTRLTSEVRHIFPEPYWNTTICPPRFLDDLNHAISQRHS